MLAHKALDALVTAPETVIVDQILPNCFGVAATPEGFFDGVAEGLAGAVSGWLSGHRVGGHSNGRFCRLLAGTAWFFQWNPGVAVNPGLAFNSTQWLAEAAQCDYLALFVQDIAHEN